MLQRAIVRPPSSNFADGLTNARLGMPVHATALEQYDEYCMALQHCGLTLTRLEPDPDYPDSTFVEDTAVLTGHTAILTLPGAPSRVGEVGRIRAALAQFYPVSQSIQPPGTLDGGDVCDAGGHFFIGLSERTNEAGALQLGTLLAKAGCTSTCVDIRGMAGLLHLKSGLAYLGDNRMVVIEALACQEAFRDYDLICPRTGEEYAANCLRIGDCLLVAAGYPAFEISVRDMGYQVLALEMSEFRKMDGGLSCLSLRL
jgi:dimethylargininase